MANILALDLGSSQLKLLVMDEKARIHAVVTRGYATQTPCAGWLEQRPEDWEAALRDGLQALSEKMSGLSIDVISFSGHMSGVVLLGKQGKPLYPCIMLADSRSEAECAVLRERVGAQVKEKTGNPIISAFSLPKLLWLKQNCTALYDAAVAWLSPKDYLRYCLTDAICTERTDAYNSLCVSADGNGWMEESIRLSGLDVSLFPPLIEPDAPAGYVTADAAKRFGLREGIPVIAGGADMACGAIGNGLFGVGDSTLTLGTCATFLAMTDRFDEQAFGKVTFHQHVLPNRMYALGSHFNGGLAVNWLTGVLSESEKPDYRLADRLSEQAHGLPPGTNGLLTLPFLAGSGSPYFCADDRQTVLGISAATTRAELFHSQLEGITLNLAQTLHVLESLLEAPLKRLVLGGGGVKIGVWAQLIANVFGRALHVAMNPDASSVGAALLGGVGVGIFNDLEQVAHQCLEIETTLAPDPAAYEQYQAVYRRYLAAYSMLQSWS